ncbi:MULTISPECIES: sensor histidine kinase [Desulfococcus]|jgi:PAS domain S-box-containing protein|uniref:histidine kinase n=1 Tax=Desulfococcus multivorans DSM 2059 TaxID=1121405 RepID=S7V742_DESML|nr:ATP-binding protein [Desulfococcus multivorans]AOY58262.1 two component system sensor histidine kinase [Desulfococcus multivorans]AQV00606.1 hypothetical protein B2D07_07370 [Desulfococcus multivorans]EPR42484.1 PAS/PAC sensor signal transduction histidine kinase [Desulfococcus multivorans DSM 2059]MDX9818454.1 ATP-binding protein [Desulfococcus multivorans]SJZ97718.1 PAS domain S-box-containing protein [Desulfococcus multivorans DSM 2059]
MDDSCADNHYAFFAAFYNAPGPIVIAREDGRFVLINKAFESAVGYAFEEIAGFSDWIDCMGGRDPTGVETYLSGLFSSETAYRTRRVSLQNKSGHVWVWNFYSAPMGRWADGLRTAISIANPVELTADQEAACEEMMDLLAEEIAKRSKDLQASINALENEIIERKRIERALTLSRERLKQMSMRVLDALEADRRTISKELHDSIGGSLAAIKFSLEEKEIDREQNGGRLDESLSREIDYLSAAIKETKRISANLRPTTLDDLGLMATLKWYLRQFRRTYGKIRVDFTADMSEEEVPEAMKIIIYRIVQEALNNAQKHSEADLVRLHLGKTDGDHTVCLVVEDNGRGFNVNDIHPGKDPLSGYGLTAMRERCEIVGGSFHIHSRIGRGTVIRAMLPRSKTDQ